MRRYDVTWTSEAVRDLEEIASYIARNSPGNARRVVRRLEQAAESLWSFPDRGRLVPELLDFGLRQWRELIIRPYRVIYRISGSRVFVEILFDARRDAESLLADRLLRS